MKGVSELFNLILFEDDISSELKPLVAKLPHQEVEVIIKFDYSVYLIPGAILTGVILVFVIAVVCIILALNRRSAIKREKSAIKSNDPSNFRLPVIDFKPTFSPRASFKDDCP